MVNVGSEIPPKQTGAGGSAASGCGRHSYNWTIPLVIPSALFSNLTPVLDGRVIISIERRLFPARPCLSTYAVFTPAALLCPVSLFSTT